MYVYIYIYIFEVRDLHHAWLHHMYVCVCVCVCVCVFVCVYIYIYMYVCMYIFEVRDLHHAWLHRTVRLVGQEPVLFSGSIHSNILYGLAGEAHGAGEADVAGGDSRRGQGRGVPEAEVRERVVAAAAIANAHDFVCGLPEGYQTGVGERGVQLSGG